MTPHPISQFLTRTVQDSRPELPILLKFSAGSWGCGQVFDWYKSRTSESTAVDRITLCRDHKGLFKHWFLVLVLQDGSICHLDRRLRGEQVNRYGAVTENGCKATDSILEIDGDSLEQMEKLSDCLTELHFDGQFDLLFILSICFCIQGDNMAN